jgi:hypothetical protein
LPQHLSCGEPGRAAADDDDLSGLGDGIGKGLRLSPFAFVTHRDHPVALVDVPARYWTQRRRSDGLSTAQIETSVVPGATHRVANYKALAERPVVMGAMGTDCKYLATAANQENLLIVHMADQHSSIRKRIESDAFAEGLDRKFSLLLGPL